MYLKMVKRERRNYKSAACGDVRQWRMKYEE
jgi:hypothetical protein